MSLLDFFKTVLPRSYNARQIRKMQLIADETERFEPQMQALSDDGLRQQTEKFRTIIKEELEAGVEYYTALEAILPEAFATVREAAVRVLGERPYPVQLIGGTILFRGTIAEMKTGEGKTLVSTLPAYLHAIDGRGVHIVTVNEYLARRDSEWMGAVHRFLGLSVGLIHHDQPLAEKQQAYNCDITYGTNNEFGFDYLRDNMATSAEHQVQRSYNYCIIDEVDSILIDEARTPLIISGPAEKTTDLFVHMAQWVKYLEKDRDFTVDEKAHGVYLNDEGIARAEKVIKVENLYAPENLKILHHLEAALKAQCLFTKDQNYVVKDGEVIIIDEFTGRMMPGRRYSDGIHGAIEAKEGVPVAQENQTLAQITFQNYFRTYKRLAGMTGTAVTEASEFAEIYDLDVLSCPTNMPMIRDDLPDRIYKTTQEKYEAVAIKAKELHAKGQPLLIGTTSIEKSERLAKLIKEQGIPCNVLNAKYHEKEAEIITQAGQKGMVTIATNMAGRGTDIKLGEGVTGLGGLYIIGSERHESRRIDNQLRGRSGRQGDPGCTQFYLSLEDDLMRIFGGDRMTRMMNFVGWEYGETIDSRMVTKAIERAQKRVESMHFEARKHILKYDNVMNEHRKIIYEQRSKALREKELYDDIMHMLFQVVELIVSAHVNEEIPKEDWEFAELQLKAHDLFHYEVPPEFEGLNQKELTEKIYAGLVKVHKSKEEKYTTPFLRHVEKIILLQTVDTAWKEHLNIMDHLKEGIGLRGYGQRDPLVEYKMESIELFNDMIKRIREETVSLLFKLEFNPARELEVEKNEEMYFSAGEGREEPNTTTTRAPVIVEKIGRNDPCPCGSGKKYKKCCGR